MSACRFCHTPLSDIILDLGTSPLSNSYISKSMLNSPETYYPLKVFYCPNCHLVQLEEYVTPSNIFVDYDYFSSYSKTWLEHAEKYVLHMRNDYGIGAGKKVVEVASNDGYLLQYFLREKALVMGIEPAVNVAQEAEKKGIHTRTEFFGRKLAIALREEGFKADLILGNNVLAHVPDINDFVSGFQELLEPDGLVTVEFPHLLNLLCLNQFDTIYHEHFSYLSLLVVREIFETHGLMVFDVRELDTHGGSLRVYACLKSAPRLITPMVDNIIARELEAGLDRLTGYSKLRESAENAKNDLLRFLLQAKQDGKNIIGYGAAAKGNTLLNFAGIRPDLLPAVADLSPYKQGKFLPGSRIPVIPPSQIESYHPDYILILPWNIKDEIIKQLSIYSEQDVRFLTAIPQLRVWP